ncbi:glycosyltransferase family 1 protein [Ktedonosporobacter rubrisoli]|uniref:Glycosyltransferase family 1 protein n=1 Tax=Ktedonosporobacter rubrisoli TaxID=2509675 RepID=A0A4P6K203_KTERU|nr:glycosyltransferase family 4 protein [Ktedonosporobacter rubrisoli]QBD82025.1 glycosyltransferase family 1 protein [Ktedonosporobacter rubrisoli]
MRILFLSNLYPPDVQGGAEILAADIAAELEALGHEVLVLTAGQDLPDDKQAGPIWRTLRSAPPAHFDRSRPAWQQLSLLVNYYRRYNRPSNAAELQRIITISRPDVLYIWEITGIGVNSLLRKLPDLHIPIVFHLGSYWLLYARFPETEQSRLRTRWLKQQLIGSVAMPEYTSLIAVSETVRQAYMQGGFDPERIEVIYNGIDPRFLTLPPERAAEGEILSLLYVGRLRVEKGLLVLLKALDLLAQRRSQRGAAALPVRLNVFGSGDQVYMNELQEFLREKRLSELVTFHGTVPQEELIKYYDRTDIMVVPSLWQEPFGLVLAEAMARSLPVLASKVGGPAEILVDGVNGLLVAPGDEQALADALGQLLEDPARRRQLGLAARKTVEERFTIQENARKVELHLQRVIAQSKHDSASLNNSGTPA